jgi:hypothetical protein
MTLLADLDRDELEEALRLHRVSEIGILAARANVARAKADKAKALWRAESERTRALAIRTRRSGEEDGYRGEAYRDAMSALIAQRGRSLDLERLYLRAESKAQAAERALRRARGAAA